MVLRLKVISDYKEPIADGHERSAYGALYKHYSVLEVLVLLGYDFSHFIGLLYTII